MLKGDYMLRYIFLISTIVVIGIGCAPNQEVKEQRQTEQISQLSTKDSPYPFIRFDLDADYDGIDHTFEVVYEKTDQSINASYENNETNVHLYGDAAMEQLHPILSTLAFNAETSDQTVLDRVIEVFNLPNDAVIHLKIDFSTGESKYYTRM